MQLYGLILSWRDREVTVAVLFHIELHLLELTNVTCMLG